MKIREKLFLLISVTILVFTMVFNSINLNIFNNRYKTEKLDSAYDTIKQILLSYSYNIDDISRFVYESCRSEGAATLLSEIQNNSNVSLGMILKSIITNQQSIKNGVFFTTEDEAFCVTRDSEANSIIELWENGFFDIERDAKWFRADNDRTFLRRSIYRVIPHVVVGYGLFEIDSDYLRSVIGMDNLKIGDLCIIDRYGDIRLTNKSANLELFSKIIESMREGSSLDEKIHYDGNDYYLVTVKNYIGTENAIYVVSEDSLLEPYYAIRRTTNQIALIAFILCAIISFLISHLFTKNIRTLQQSINGISSSNERLSQVQLIRNHDEIGDLANDFNRLLEKIDILNEKNMREREAQQNTKYEMLEWQYRALQSLVSPHFLCNILSSISMLSAVGNYEEVQCLSVNASKYLRQNLNCSSNKTSTVEEEIKISEDYISLASAMSAVPIKLVVSCPSELKNLKIVSYILQPLVENCVKHGMPPVNSEEFVISINVSNCNGMIVIVVADNGQGFSESFINELDERYKAEDICTDGISFGLEGIIRRLKLQYSEKIKFTIGNNSSQGGATVTLMFPYDN